MFEWKIGKETVFVSDLDESMVSVSKLDKLEPGDESRRLIQGKAALLIVAEYGLTLYGCAHPGEGISVPLLVVIDENVVYISVSYPGKMTVFVGAYDEKAHGAWVKKLTKSSLWDFSNIDARLDGWAFHADMVSQSMRAK